MTEGLRRLCRERGLGLLNREEFEAGLEDLTWRLAPGCEIEERPGGVQVLRFLVRHRQTRTLAHRVEVPLW